MSASMPPPSRVASAGGLPGGQGVATLAYSQGRAQDPGWSASVTRNDLGTGSPAASNAPAVRY
jgi:hypothetical protein